MNCWNVSHHNNWKQCINDIIQIAKRMQLIVQICITKVIQKHFSWKLFKNLTVDSTFFSISSRLKFEHFCIVKSNLFGLKESFFSTSIQSQKVRSFRDKEYMKYELTYFSTAVHIKIKFICFNEIPFSLYIFFFSSNIETNKFFVLLFHLGFQ